MYLDYIIIEIHRLFNEFEKGKVAYKYDRLKYILLWIYFSQCGSVVTLKLIQADLYKNLRMSLYLSNVAALSLGSNSK